MREAAAGNGTLLAIVEPLLAAWQALREQIAVFDRQILSRAKTDAVIRRLMTIPGVGAIVALSYTAAIDDPARFRRSSSVGGSGCWLRRPGGISPVRLMFPAISQDAAIACCARIFLRPPM